MAARNRPETRSRWWISPAKFERGEVLREWGGEYGGVGELFIAATSSWGWPVGRRGVGTLLRGGPATASTIGG